MNLPADIAKFQSRLNAMKFHLNPTPSSSSSSSSSFQKCLEISLSQPLKRSLPSSISVSSMEDEEEETYLRLNLIEKHASVRDILRPCKKTKFSEEARKMVASDLFSFLTYDIPLLDSQDMSSSSDIIGSCINSNSFWSDMLTMEAESAREAAL